MKIKIQPEQRVDGVLPYPFFIEEKGDVGRQDFWKGRPKRLIGFSPIKEQKFHEDQIDCVVFMQEPEMAVGMYPIFEHKDGEWYTYQEKIESVKVL